MTFKPREVIIFEPAAPEHFDAIRVLIKEYCLYLYSLPNMRLHVDLQEPDVEIAEIENGKYGPPAGALLLAAVEGEFVGMVAIRIITSEICEMKRLYVKPGGRGASIGYQLATRIIRKARELGYQKMRLDTHPDMTKAHAMYYGLGFRDIPRYNHNLVPHALFMELLLAANV